MFQTFGDGKFYRTHWSLHICESLGVNSSLVIKKCMRTLNEGIGFEIMYICQPSSIVLKCLMLIPCIDQTRFSIYSRYVIPSYICIHYRQNAMNSGKKRFCLSQSERMQLKRVVVQLANKIHVDRHYYTTILCD